MKKNRLILCTCGTSILTNGCQDDERKILNRNSNIKSINDIEIQEDKRLINQIIEKKREKLLNSDFETVKRMSAELNGLFTFYKGFPYSEDMIYLLPTDTLIGKGTADIIKDYLTEKSSVQVSLIEQSDLQTKDYTLFHSALSELTIKLSTLFDTFSYNYQIFYNLTGGFKSVNAFLQTLAQFFADEVFYLFESSDQLMRIPKLPIQFSIKDVMEAHIQVVRRMQLGLKIHKEDINNIPEILIMELDNEYALSAWGGAIWESLKKELYLKKLYDSPDQKIQYGHSFLESVKSLNLNNQRIFELNKKIDDLVKYAHSNRKYNPVSLDCKKIKGLSKDVSQYECDAWHNEDAKRIFFHFENECLILDKLDKALH
jgi:putative CRISPR-associated protein (TIGR02619 family)